MEQIGNGSAALARITELTDLLHKASEAYYAGNTELMSNLEYDRLYDELRELETRTGITLAGSPTASVEYTLAKELPKERHERPMLSLDKTKSREALRDWLGDHEGLLSWKMDGLTIVLTYQGRELVKAVTRGNGEVGEVITANARVFENIPLRIPYEGTLVVRGEAVIRYSDFERINRELEEKAVKDGDVTGMQYKNPRNLCSGSVRQLSSEVTAKRSVRFYAFSLVQAQDVDFHDSREQQMLFLRQQGFEVVPYLRVSADTVEQGVETFSAQIPDNDIPTDGLVLLLDEITYGESLGMTSKFPRNAIAFKWADELQETTLREVEWSASRTGLINPIAVFDPVELEGTTVQRASVHNVSIVRALKLGIGDRITVYKANMIIPQIAENLTGSGTLEIPGRCPVCGAPTLIRGEGDTQVLVCTNPDCAAKKLRSFVQFVSRGALGIDGLSEKRLEKLIAEGFVHTYADIFRLEQHRDAIAQMEGFGAKSADNLLQAIENARETTPDRVLGAVGIPGIGAANARVLSSICEGNLEALRQMDEEALAEAEGIGPVLASSIKKYLADPDKYRELSDLLGELRIRKPEPGNGPQPLAGMTFVITGKVNHFPNRDALKAQILSLGGKAAGSVSAKTTYLINNDSTSTSGKNKKARELGIPVITEEEFMKLAGL